MSTWAGWPNSKRLASTCGQIWARPKSTQVHAARRKSMQVDTSGWPNETHVERKSKTCVDLRVRWPGVNDWRAAQFWGQTLLTSTLIKVQELWHNTLPFSKESREKAARIVSWLDEKNCNKTFFSNLAVEKKTLTSLLLLIQYPYFTSRYIKKAKR